MLMAKIARQVLLLVASMIMAALAIFLTMMSPPIYWIVGGHCENLPIVFPVYTLVFYALVNFLPDLLRRPGGGDSAKPPLKFSWLSPLAVVGLLCGCLILLIAFAMFVAVTSAPPIPGVVDRGFEPSPQATAEAGVLLKAIRKGDRQGVEARLAQGADVNARDAALGSTALITASRLGRREIAELLLAKGAEIEARDNFGSTALITASKKGRVQVVLLLLAKGAEVNAAQNNGETALYFAAIAGHREVVRALLAQGADVDAKANGKTALGAAIARGDLEILQTLLAQGADVNIRGSSGNTPLVFAAGEGKLEAVKLLLAHGADADSKNRALQRATWKKHQQVRELLLQAGAN